MECCQALVSISMLRISLFILQTFMLVIHMNKQH
nr:MAG TPA: hypothetical protein [Crassvirales sp.]